MKSALFASEHMTPIWDDKGSIVAFDVPTLCAYAIEFADLSIPRHLDAGFIPQTFGKDFTIDGGRVALKHPSSSPFYIFGEGMRDFQLVIHHHGIRDYALLFPQVTDSELQRRLGAFYEESEKAFEIGAWLSFALMASAVYEGLLGWRIGDPRMRLRALIQAAVEKGIVSESEARILSGARRTRNLIHASLHKINWVTRADAMDMRAVQDKLVRSLSKVLTAA